MTRAKWLALNALSLLLANIFSKLVLLAGSVFLLQYLSPASESIYYLVTAFSLLLVSNFQDGMVQVTIRRIATDRDNGAKYLSELALGTYLLSLVIAAVGFLSAVAYGHLQFESSTDRNEFIVSACGLVAAYLAGYGYAVAGAGFKAYEKLYLESILLVFQAALNAAVYVAGAKLQWPLSMFFFGLLATSAFHSLVSWLVLARFVVVPSAKASVREAWMVFRESAGLGCATLLRTLQDRVHVFFITSILGFQMNTQFASPNNFLAQLKFIPLSIRPALFPTLARKAESSTAEFEEYSTALIKFLFLTAIPIMIVLTIAREEVLPLFTEMGPGFKSTYAAALQVFPLVALSVSLSFPSQVLRNVFVSIRRPRYEFYTVLGGVGLLALVDLILIPRIGVLGAGVGAVAAESFILAWGFWLLRRDGWRLDVFRALLVPAGCGIVTYLTASRLYAVHWLAGVVCVIVLFPLLAGVARVVSPGEWVIIRQMVGTKKSADTT